MISRYAIQALRYLAIGIIVLLGLAVSTFLMLSQTQRGRNLVQDQLVHQFNQRYEGHLDIGQISGSLTGKLVVSDVHLHDPTGRLLAVTDSIVVEPRWHDLLRRHIGFRTTRLVRPRLYLYRSNNGGWNLRPTFQPRDTTNITDDAGPSGIRFSVGQLFVEDGEVYTTNHNERPPLVARGHLFDYTNSKLEDIHIRSTIDWSPGFTLLDVRFSTGSIPSIPLTIQLLEGQLQLDHNAIQLSQVRFATEYSHIRMNGTLPAGESTSEDTPRIRMAVAESQVQGQEVSRVFPGLNLQHTLSLSADISGTRRNLNIQPFELHSSGSTIRGQGNIQQWPDSVRLAVDVKNSTLAPADLHSLLPDLPLTPYHQVGPGKLSFSSWAMFYQHIPSRTAESPRLRAASAFTYSTLAGTVRGHARASQDQTGQWTFQSDVNGQNIALERLRTDAPTTSNLTGQISIKGAYTADTNWTSSGTIDLRHSQIDGRRIDEAHAAVKVSPGLLEGRVDIRQPQGSLEVSNFAFNRDRNPRLQLQAQAENLDLGPLLAIDTVTTRVTGRLTMKGQRSSKVGLHGNLEVDVDSSLYRTPRRRYSIRPSYTSVVLRPSTSESDRLTISGDIVDGRMTGEFTYGSLAASTQLWGHTFARTWRKLTQKPRRQTLTAETDAPAEAILQRLIAPTDTVTSEQIRSDRRRLRNRLADAGLSDSVQIDADLTLKRPELFTAVVPDLPRTRGRIRFQTHWVGGLNKFSWRSALEGTEVGINEKLKARSLSVQLSARGRFQPTLERTSRITASGTAEGLEVSGKTLETVEWNADFSESVATTRVQAQGSDPDNRLLSELTLMFRPDRNVLTIDTVDVKLRQTRWQTPHPQRVDLYSEAAVFHNLTILNPRDALSPAFVDTTQRIRINGVLSAADDETATASIEHLYVGEIAQYLSLPYTVRGIADLTVAINPSENQTLFDGAGRIRNVSFDDHPLGTIRMQGTYDTPTQQLRVDLNLRRSEPLPSGIANNVSVAGWMELPSYDLTGEVVDPGTLNLVTNVEEADLFFFEHIFRGDVDQVQASTAGQGTIRGTFTRPIFNGKFTVDDGHFRLPQYNLGYTLDGDVTVDREGFHLQNVAVTDTTGGQATANGDIYFNDYRYFSFDLQGTLDQLPIMDVEQSRDLPFYGHIAASGEVSLTGPIFDASLRSSNLVTTPTSELFIPVIGVEPETDEAFIVFADTANPASTLRDFRDRSSVLPNTSGDNRTFVEGLEMSLNISAPRGSRVYLVFDPLLGDVVEAVGTGEVQIEIQDGNFSTFGTFRITGGEYRFTASEMFSRRFQLEPGGTIKWNGDPINAELDISATYRTRASLAGLPGHKSSEHVPVIIWLEMTGSVSSPVVDLRMSIDRDEPIHTTQVSTLEPILNDEERSAEYATSVLLTNSFRLTVTGNTQGITHSVDQLAFNTVSQLVASQLNRFINQALGNIELNLGVQQGTTVEDMDLSYGVALYLLDERLVIRGQGIYDTQSTQTTYEGVQGKITVEIHLNPGVSAEIFYRREYDLFESVTRASPAYGAGLSYQANFTSWEQFLINQFQRWQNWWHGLVRWLLPSSSTPAPRTAAESPGRPDSTTQSSTESRQSLNTTTSKKE